MSQSQICLVTPSYAPDFARCQLLTETIARYNRSPFNHYIIVDRQDLALFKQLENQNTVVIPKEELLPKWLVKIPFFTKKNIWFSWKTLPVRGWLVQQLIKLAIAEYVSEDIIVFADSDVFFVRDFDLNHFVKEDKVRFFAQPNQIKDRYEFLAKWYFDASDLLNIEEPQFPTTNYMGQLVFWRKDNVIKLHRHLEQESRRSWVETICANWNVSEYILYGVFIEQVLKDASGHYFDSCDLCHNYWEEQSLQSDRLQDFFDGIESNRIAAMLSAKAGIPVESYHHLVYARSMSTER